MYASIKLFHIYMSKNSVKIVLCEQCHYVYSHCIILIGGGRVVRWCWVCFQCWGVLLSLIQVGQGHTALAVGAGWGCLDIFSLVYHFSFLSPSLWEMARYRLKYCLKGPLSPKQPTDQIRFNKGVIISYKFDINKHVFDSVV